MSEIIKREQIIIFSIIFRLDFKRFGALKNRNSTQEPKKWTDKQNVEMENSINMA